MNVDSNLLASLRRSNPMPTPEHLVESDAARALAFRSPLSLLDWRIIGENEYEANPYRIQLAAPGRWEITFRGTPLAHHHSLKSAFAIVERHYRESIRRRDLLRLGGVVLGVLLLLTAIDQYVAKITDWRFDPHGEGITLFWLVVMFVAIFMGLSALIRFFAVLSRNVNDPYRQRAPWERASSRRRSSR